MGDDPGATAGASAGYGGRLCTETIVGQGEAVKEVATASMRRRIVGRLWGRDRPASFLFVGPTGCRQDGGGEHSSRTGDVRGAGPR